MNKLTEQRRRKKKGGNFEDLKGGGKGEAAKKSEGIPTWEKIGEITLNPGYHGTKDQNRTRKKKERKKKGLSCKHFNIGNV